MDLPTAAPARRQRPPGPREHGSHAGLVFAGYLAIAFLFLGLRLVAHPESTIVGDHYSDPQLFVWSFAWWPHAILHGDNPFYSHAIWAPSGFDLAWATSVPALAVAFSPLTLAFGAILSYDVACIVTAALNAFAAFLLCRRLTRALWPSIVGGYLFGFSSYVLGGELDHLHTVAVFTLPLVALVVLRAVQGTIGRRALVAQLGLLVALQAYLSTEILFTLTLALAGSLVIAVVASPSLGRRLVGLVPRLLAAYALAAVLAAPLAYYALSGYASRPPAGAETYVTDALNFVVPTVVSLGGFWGRGLSGHFPGNDVEQGAYLGLPTLAIVAWYALRRWRTPGGRFLLLSMLLAAIASLGSWLTVDGHRLFALPWLHLAYRPLFEDMVPSRLSAFTALAASVVVAIWAADRGVGRWIRRGGCALAVVAILPNLSLDQWARRPQVPVFFTSQLARSCLGRGVNVLAFPYGPRDDSMLWQVESGFWFRMAGGYIAPYPPPAFTEPASIQRIAADDLPPKVTSASIRLFTHLKDVGVVILDAREEPFWRPILDRLARPEPVGGVIIYRLGGTRPASSTGCAGR